MTFNIHYVDIKFHLSLTPSDMKFLALLAGELTNSITDPCSYARTTQIHLLSLLKSEDWQPWIFQERLEHADTVKRYKGSLTKDHKENQTKITKYIASLQSRQEHIPALGKYVDRIMAEPLHLRNDGWQYWHVQIF